MSKAAGTLRHACRSRRGVATTEFLFIFLALITVLVGIIEVSWQSTVAAALDRATLRASRFGTTGQATRTGVPADITCRSQAIPWILANAAGNVLRLDRILITTGAHSSAANMAAPATPGAGGGSQVVTYTVTYREPFLTGAWLQLIGGPDYLVHRSTVVVKNEAFDNATC